MGFEMIFLGAVLGIGGIHLLFNLVNFLARPNRARVQESFQKKVREDWYVFFNKSALYGDVADIAITPEVIAEDDFEFNLACEEDSCQPQEAYS